jgi:hypothetical protein
VVDVSGLLLSSQPGCSVVRGDDSVLVRSQVGFLVIFLYFSSSLSGRTIPASLSPSAVDVGLAAEVVFPEPVVGRVEQRNSAIADS